MGEGGKATKANRTPEAGMWGGGMGKRGRLTGEHSAAAEAAPGVVGGRGRPVSKSTKAAAMGGGAARSDGQRGDGRERRAPP